LRERRQGLVAAAAAVAAAVAAAAEQPAMAAAGLAAAGLAGRLAAGLADRDLDLLLHRHHLAAGDGRLIRDAHADGAGDLAGHLLAAHAGGLLHDLLRHALVGANLHRHLAPDLPADLDVDGRRDLHADALADRLDALFVLGAVHPHAAG